MTIRGPSGSARAWGWLPFLLCEPQLRRFLGSDQDKHPLADRLNLAHVDQP
jgi:hypothetical protein